MCQHAADDPELQSVPAILPWGCRPADPADDERRKGQPATVQSGRADGTSVPENGWNQVTFKKGNAYERED